MRLARPSTLWRFIARELWKLLLLTAAVVVAVAVFGFTVRPLADGRLGPVEALRFMAYAIIPMLQYALPFAAGFAATLTYHRLAADNEATAVFAAGISHRRLLVPAAATGLALGGIMLLLADQAMPRLLRAAQELITRDAAKVLVGQIQNGESVRFGQNLQLYADSVTTLGPDPRSGAFEHLVLAGVLAVELSDTGAITKQASGSVANVWLYRGRPGRDPSGNASDTAATTAAAGGDAGGGTTVVLRLRDVVAQTSEIARSELTDSTIVYRVPDAMQDDPKYFSWAQLRRVRAEPERMDWIDQRRRNLAAALSESLIAEQVGGVLAREGKVWLTDAAGRSVLLRAGGLVPLNAKPAAASASAPAGEGWAILPIASRTAGQPPAIEVTTIDSLGGSRVQRARAGVLLPQRDAAANAAAPLALGGFSIRLDDVTGSTLDAAHSPVAPAGVDAAQPDAPASPMPPAGRVDRWSLEGLQLPTGEHAGLPELSTRELLDKASRPPFEALPRVRAIASDLSSEVYYLNWEITSKLNERAAVAAASALMVLCGGVLGLRHALSLPLTVYLWSFLPALACLLTISGGQKSTHSYAWAGLPLLWGGVVAMAAFTLLEYRRLARH
jgi:hypothetical protein